jgi:ATP-dependent helicase HrpA
MARFDAGEFDQDEPLIKMLQRFVEERVSPAADGELPPENLNPHCFMNFRVQDEHGRIVGQSRNLAELRTKYRDQVAARFQSARIVPADAPAPKKGAPRRRRRSSPRRPARPGRRAPARRLHRLELRPAAELLEVKVAGREIVGFPALHDDGSSVCAPSTRRKRRPRSIAAAWRGCSRWSSRPR